MKIAIIEDEALAAETLAEIILEIRPQTEVLNILPSVEEAVEWFQAHDAPELLFCDIHLSDGLSFEIFQQMNIKCPVIFTTAYNQYAIEAFRINSIDYLLKPIKKDEVERAIKKYESLREDDKILHFEKLQELLKNQHIVTQQKSRFLVKSGQSSKVVPTKDVAYFKAEEGIVLLVDFSGSRYAINYTLEQIEDQIDEMTFFRANRHLIVNIEAVQKVEPYFKGRLLLQIHPKLKDDQIVSSKKASAFKQWLDL